MTENAKLNILICGLGSIGNRHCRLLLENYPKYELTAFRTYQGQGQNDLSLSELISWEDVDEKTFDVAFITNPTSLHIEYALECARRRINLFIEKPIDCKCDRLDKLLVAVKEFNLTAYVAYPLRFHPAIRELKNMLNGQKVLHSRIVCTSYLPDWRHDQDHRLSYSSYKEKGGGVILDLSHEIDLAEYLFGDVNDISGRFDKVSDITVNSEDYCDLLVKHNNGFTNLHMNYFSRLKQRFLEVDTDRFSVKVDLLNNHLDYHGSNKSWIKTYTCTMDDIYLTQLKYYFNNLHNCQIDNNVFDASKLFRKIIEFREGK